MKYTCRHSSNLDAKLYDLYTSSAISFIAWRLYGVNMYYSPFLRKRNQGITIVELMLVVVVFSILAAIILPLFSRAKATSYRTQCAGNLRQLGVAFTNYASDWNGSWPSPGGLAGDRNYWAQSGNGGLESYVRQRGVNSVWCCPMQEQWHSRYPARSYSMNSYLREPPDIHYPTCISNMRGVNIGGIFEPQRTILLYEGLMLTTGWENTSLYEYIYRCANWQFVRGFSVYNIPKTAASEKPWHGKVNNYLYCDGHIVSRPPGKKYSDTLYSTYQEMYQWYVSKKRFHYEYATVISKIIPDDPTAPK